MSIRAGGGAAPAKTETAAAAGGAGEPPQPSPPPHRRGHHGHDYDHHGVRRRQGPDANRGRGLQQQQQQLLLQPRARPEADDRGAAAEERFQRLLREAMAVEEALARDPPGSAQAAAAYIAADSPDDAAAQDAWRRGHERKLESARLKGLYASLIVDNVDWAAQSGLDERLWRVFHSRSQELRAVLRQNLPPQAAERARHDLFEHVDVGIGFYHRLVENLRIFALDPTDSGKSAEGDGTSTFDLVAVENWECSLVGAGEAVEHYRTVSRFRDTATIAAVAAVQRAVISLGDLARYRDSVRSVEVNGTPEGARSDLRLAELYYEKARRVWSDNGRAQAQLAFVADARGNSIDVVYWHVISLCVKRPSTISEDNLRKFYSRFNPAESSEAGNAGAAGPAGEGDGGAEDASSHKAFQRFTELALHVHRHALYDGGEKSNPPAAEAIACLQLFFTSLAAADMPTVLANAVRDALCKLVVVFGVTVWFLQEKVRCHQDDPGTLRSFRSRQTLALSFGFDVCRVILDAVVLQAGASAEEDDAENAPLAANPRVFLAASASELLAPAALWADLCNSNATLIAQLVTLADSPRPCTSPVPGHGDRAGKGEETLKKRIFEYFACSRALLRLVVPAVAKSDVRRALPEDVQLLGLATLKDLNAEAISVPAQAGGAWYPPEKARPVAARERLRRILAGALKFAEMKSFKFQECGNRGSGFIVVEEEAKKRDRERQMRAMAQQLLKDQVSHLEQNLGNVSVSGMARVGAVKPRDVVVDVTVLLEQFPVLKRILSSGKYHVTLLLNVIDELDVLKKGTGVVNVRAREAVRYLDHTLSKRGPSRTPPPASRGGRRDQQQQHQKRTMLRVQRHNERLPAWSAAAEFLLPPTGALDAAAAASPDHPFTFEHVSKVPKRLRDAISCCLWRRKAGACGQEDATGQAAVVTLVTEDAEQAEFAARFGIETCRTRDLPC